MDIVQALSLHRQNRTKRDCRDIDPFLSIDWSSGPAGSRMLICQADNERKAATVLTA